MHNLGIRSEGMELPGNAVIEAGADGKKEIAFSHCHICRIAAVHSQIPDKQRMIGRHCSPAHNCSYYRDICLIDNLRKHIIRTGNIDASACKEEGFLCLFQHLQRLLELSHVNTCVRFIAPDINC